LAILGAKHGPRASSLIAEIGKDDVLAILSVI
jgi:lysyl-tRNA synthetase class I